MKPRSENEDWVISLRTFLRDELGASWQVKEKRGSTNLRIRLEDGSRIYRNLGLKWNKANSPKIRASVEEIRNLVIEKKVPIDEAIERELEHIASEYGLNEELITIAWETWVLKRAKQVEE